MAMTIEPCADCGMPCEPGEYHPFAACLMFKACHRSGVVRANLQFVVDHGKDAHLTQPAQAVDVGAIREVIAELTKPDMLHAPYVTRAADKLTRALAGEQAGWRPIATAPKDGTPVLVWMRPAGELPIRAERFADLKFVAVNRGDYAEWGFAAPVGMGGFPDSWIWRWIPLPPEQVTP